MFVDTYLVADDYQTLAAYCSFYRNVIGPQAGISGVLSGGDENGTSFSAQEARGDPQKAYACIRANKEIEPPEGISVISREAGAMIVGVWA